MKVRRLSVAFRDAPAVEQSRPAVLGGLSSNEQRTLAYASAIGHEFDFSLLVAAMGSPEEGLAEELERLVQQGILRERPGGDRFTFVQDEWRARIYQSLTASRLRVIHRKIAEAMERVFPEPPPESLAELGRHFFLGKVPEKSFRYNRKAASIARENDSPEDAAHFLERSRIDLKSIPGDHASEESLLAGELGDLYFSMGDVRNADRAYFEALQKAGDDVRLKARLLLARAEVARENFDADAAVQGAREARELFARSGDVSGIASVHRILGRIAFHRGAYREALDEGIRALDLLQPTGDQRVLGRLCIDIGNAFSMLGPEMTEEAVDWYERAVDRLSEVGDWGEVARAHVNRGSVIGPANPAAALEALNMGREFAERAHEPRWIGWALAKSVEFRLALGQVEEARQDNEQARRLLERADDTLGNYQVALNDGLIEERRAAWDEAEAAFRKAIERADRLGTNAEMAEVQFYLARLLFKTRDVARAREAYQAAVHLNLPALMPSLADSFHQLGRELGAAGSPAAEEPHSATLNG